jgi:uncharacterized glyoxalase superfamily protein PhnB
VSEWTDNFLQSLCPARAENPLIDVHGGKAVNPINHASPSITPALLYHNAPDAIDWLCRAFGFEKKLVVPGDNGTIAHATLRYGNGLLMLSSAESNAYRHLQKSPREAGIGTCTICVVVTDPDAHCARARAAEAEIVLEIEDKPYGGRGYSARDPEGHLWHFGSYDPWTEQ